MGVTHGRLLDNGQHQSMPSTGASAVNASLERDVNPIRLAKILFCAAIPAAVWIAPFSCPPEARLALVISAFMVAAWMTEVMDYAASGMIGLTLFWALKVAKPTVIFGGFVNDASWFYLGAMLLGAMTSKSGLPQRMANFVVSRVGLTYSRLLLGLIIVDFLLTFLVPSGAAIVVIMASLAIGLMNLFGVEKGSNIGRGMFLVITYTSSIFNKMIIAGTASIVARSLIHQYGGVDVSWALWFIAFFPCAVGTILVSWWITLLMFPPEAESLASREEELKAHFRADQPMTRQAIKSAVLSAFAIVLWMTDWLHHIPSAVVALGIGLVALMPYVDVLDENDFRKINLLPFFFVGAALGMSEVLKVTGGLDVLTDMFVSGIAPYLTDKMSAVVTLYWSGFFYHFATASEVSMLVTSMPILMEFAKSHHLNPAWIGMIWSFASGGKLFAYQSAVLVVGYSYGYFRHQDLLKMGAILTIVEFALLALSVLFFWPYLGLGI